MADFNPLGQIGGLVRKLPSAAEAVGNFFLPGVGTLAQKYGNKKTFQNIPVGKIVEGAANVGGIGTSIAGGLTSEAGVGIPLVAGGMALSSAAHGLGNEAQYRWNQLMGQGGPQSPNGIQTGKYGRTDWNPSANPSTQRGSQQAADRAYQSHVASVAQQTAQNPLFQKYQVADLTKQYNTAANPAEKQRLGLEIWAQTNPLLAAKLKSGQVGYAEARTAPGMSNAGGLPIGGLPMPTTQFNAVTDVSTPGTMEQTFGTPVRGYGMVSATPMVYNPGTPQGPVTDGMIQSSYGQQLFSSPDFAKIAKDKAFLQQAYQQQGLK
jgi:hypothetical protein